MMDSNQDRHIEDATPAGSRPGWRRASTIVWLAASVAFLGFLFLGSVPARIWRLGSLHVESKSIAGVWAVQLDHLPDQFPQWLMVPLFAGSMIVFVAGVVVGLRLLLAPDASHDG